MSINGEPSHRRDTINVIDDTDPTRPGLTNLKLSPWWTDSAAGSSIRRILRFVPETLTLSGWLRFAASIELLRVAVDSGTLIDLADVANAVFRDVCTGVTVTTPEGEEFRRRTPRLRLHDTAHLVLELTERVSERLRTSERARAALKSLADQIAPPPQGHSDPAAAPSTVQAPAMEPLNKTEGATPTVACATEQPPDLTHSHPREPEFKAPRVVYIDVGKHTVVLIDGETHDYDIEGSGGPLQIQKDQHPPSMVAKLVYALPDVKGDLLELDFDLSDGRLEKASRFLSKAVDVSLLRVADRAVRLVPKGPERVAFRRGLPPKPKPRGAPTRRGK